MRNSGTAVAELRAAATEAGISADAFDAALGEWKTAEDAPAPVAAVSTRRWRRLFFGLAGIGAFVVLAATIVIPMRVAPRGFPGAQVTIQLNCLPADKAVDMIRPLVTGPGSTVVRPGNSTSTIFVRGTPEEVQKVTSLMEQVDNAQACARR